MSTSLNIALFIGWMEPGPAGGTAHYTARLLSSLARTPTRHRFTLLAQSNLSRDAVDYYSKAAGSNLKWQFYEAHPYRAQYTNLLQYLHARNPGHKKAAWAADHLLPENRLLARSFDLIYSPGQDLPCLRPSIPTVVTLHDVQELHFPLFFDAQERVRRAMRNFVYAAANHHFIVSYEHVKQDLMRAYSLAPGRIHVLPHAPHVEPDAPSGAISGVLPHALSDTPYMLYPAQTWQHKNHLGLVRAFARALRQCPGLALNLVCTGACNEHFPAIQAEMETLGISGRVHFTGFIPRPILIALYSRAAFVIIPTLYEAGSYPLLEAIQLGVPAVCSAVTSLPEAMGDPSYLFNPAKEEEIAAIIIRMASDDAFREACRIHVRTRAATLKAHSEAWAENFASSFGQIFDVVVRD